MEEKKSKASPKQHRCPLCGRPIQYEGNPFRPFCTQRCKMIDLGAWLKEDYRIADPACLGNEAYSDLKENAD
jgi:endogenous inhibitor of DNA gyrase (YacG/DUF329 family)